MGGSSQSHGGRRAGRAAAVPVAVLAAGLVAAACGSSGTSTASGTGVPAASPQATATVRKVTQSTLQAGTADVSVRVQTNERSTGTGRLGLAMVGGFEFTKQDGSVIMSVTGLAPGTTSPALHLVFAQGNLYLQATGQLANLGGGKPWVSITPSSLSQLFSGVVPGSAAGPIASAVTADPLSVLGILDTADLSAARIGSRTVAGVATTEYDVTVDPVAAAKHASGAAQKLFTSLGTKPVTVQVWLDGQNRLVQFQATATGAPASSPASSGTSAAPIGVTVVMTKFGSPVSVTVPPLSQVAVPPGSSGSSSGSVASSSSAG